MQAKQHTWRLVDKQPFHLALFPFFSSRTSRQTISRPRSSVFVEDPYVKFFPVISPYHKFVLRRMSLRSRSHKKGFAAPISHGTQCESSVNCHETYHALYFNLGLFRRSLLFLTVNSIVR